MKPNSVTDGRCLFCPERFDVEKVPILHSNTPDLLNDHPDEVTGK